MHKRVIAVIDNPAVVERIFFQHPTTPAIADSALGGCVRQNGTQSASLSD